MLIASPPRVCGERGAVGGDTPNNHLAYAVQWFLFAARATIYILATPPLAP